MEKLNASSRRTPCPICGRTKDGDCRISDELVLCHYGSTKHPPQQLKPGQVIPGDDGQEWAFTGDAKDGRTAAYTRHKPRPTNHQAPVQARQSQAPTPQLARLESPAKEPQAHLPTGQRINYSSTQWVEIVRNGNEKKHIPHHQDDEGRAQRGAGDEPWPLWRQDDAITHGVGMWIAEAEGEKCGAWFRAGGVVAISQPGHDHKPASIERRYRNLVEAGVAGVLYLADNDETGRKKAERCAATAATVGLPLLVLHAFDVWSDMPVGGSIDEAPGTAAERVSAVLAAISAAIKRIPDPSPAEVKQSWRELLDAMLKATIDGDDDELMELRAQAKARFRVIDPQLDAALFKLHTKRETQGKKVTPPESLDLSRISGMDFLVDGFIPDNDQTLIWGNAGSGKTTAALAIACSVLRCTGLLDHTRPSARRNALFIASDSGASPLIASMQEMGMDAMPEVQDGPEKAFHVWAPDHDQGMTAWAADLPGCIMLLEFIKRHQIGLVLIDSCKAVCSGAGLDYQQNPLVTSLLTYFKEVICPHTAVVWLNHDGTAKGANAGAKAWKEIPSMVHSIIREEKKDGTIVDNRRL